MSKEIDKTGSFAQWLKTAVKTLDPSEQFFADTQMFMAKSRLRQALADNPARTTDIKDIGLEEIARLAGIPTKLFVWAEKNPMFLIWLCDDGYEKRRLDALADEAIGVLQHIAFAPIDGKLLTAKDKVNAVNLLMQLGDRFPNKRKEFVYIDKELAKMNDADVQRESAKLDRLLSSGQDDT